jgi:DNA-binding MarR family transcriptional regulator
MLKVVSIGWIRPYLIEVFRFLFQRISIFFTKTSNFTSIRGLIPLVLLPSRRKEPMTLHQLSIWIVVAKHQNVTMTADELHIRQPSVSQQIRSLEEDCGIKLYKVHTGKGIELTPAGKLLLKYAKKILSQVKTLESKLKSSRKRRGRRR